MKIIITESQFRLLVEDDFANRTTFDGVSGNSLSDDEKIRLYELFRNSYQKAIGVSWSQDKFLQKINNWLLYGDSEGFVAVREQASGLLKLTGSAGGAKSIMLGIQMLNSLNRPIWGLVSESIAATVGRKGFIVPGKFIVTTLFKFIPRSVFGGFDVQLNSDGSINSSADDTGTTKKFFVANRQYFKTLLSLPNIPDSIPNVIKLWIGKL